MAATHKIFDKQFHAVFKNRAVVPSMVLMLRAAGVSRSHAARIAGVAPWVMRSWCSGRFAPPKIFSAKLYANLGLDLTSKHKVNDWLVSQGLYGPVSASRVGVHQRHVLAAYESYLGAHDAVPSQQALVAHAIATMERSPTTTDATAYTAMRVAFNKLRASGQLANVNRKKEHAPRARPKHIGVLQRALLAEYDKHVKLGQMPDTAILVLAVHQHLCTELDTTNKAKHKDRVKAAAHTLIAKGQLHGCAVKATQHAAMRAEVQQVFDTLMHPGLAGRPLYDFFVMTLKDALDDTRPLRVAKQLAMAPLVFERSTGYVIAVKAAAIARTTRQLLDALAVKHTAGGQRVMDESFVRLLAQRIPAAHGDADARLALARVEFAQWQNDTKYTAACFSAGGFVQSL